MVHDSITCPPLIHFTCLTHSSCNKNGWPDLCCLCAVCFKLLCSFNVICSKANAAFPPHPWAVGISYSCSTGWYSALNPGIVSAPWCLIGSVQIHVYANLTDISSCLGWNGKQWLHFDEPSAWTFPLSSLGEQRLVIYKFPLNRRAWVPSLTFPRSHIAYF